MPRRPSSRPRASRVLYPTRDPARVGIQSTFLDPDSEFYPCRSLRLRIQRLWIPTRAGSPLGNQESVLQEISFSRQQPAARQGAQPSTSNVQPAGRRPLLGGVLRRCTPGGLPEIRGVLPRRRAGSRTPLAGWAPPNWHLGTSPLLVVITACRVPSLGYSKTTTCGFVAPPSKNFAPPTTTSR